METLQKGNKVRLLFNGQGGIKTCFDEGDILIVESFNYPFYSIIGIRKNDPNKVLISQSVRFNQIELVNDTEAFPSEGWCKDATKDLGKYLSLIYDAPYIAPGDTGYAWNSTSYWKIDIYSQKPSYSFDVIKKIMIKKGYVFKTEKEEIKTHAYDVGACLEVIACYHGHGFQIGEKIQVLEKHVADHFYTCFSIDKPGSANWAIHENETILIAVEEDKSSIKLKFKKGDIVKLCRLGNSDFDTRFTEGTILEVSGDLEADRTYRCTMGSQSWWINEKYLEKHNWESNEIFEVTKMGSHNFYLGEKIKKLPISTSDNGQAKYESIDRKEVSWWLYPNEIIPLKDSSVLEIMSTVGIDKFDENKHSFDKIIISNPANEVLTFQEDPNKTLFNKIKKLLYSEPSVVKDRTIKPIKVKIKETKIEKGLIVPLEPIKNRIIK